VQHLHLTISPLVQLGVLDRDGDELGQGVHQRQIVVVELVRGPGVQRDDAQEPVGRRDDRDRQVRLQPVVVQLGDGLEARVCGRVVADDAGLARQGRPPGEALAHGHGEAADPLLVALDARTDDQPLAILVPEVDQRPDAPGQLGAQLDDVCEQLVQAQCGGERGHHVEHGPHVGPVALQDVTERPRRVAGLCASCPSFGSRRDRLNHRQRSSWLRRRQNSMVARERRDYARCTPVWGMVGRVGDDQPPG
jgi:hypothetical protein